MSEDLGDRGSMLDGGDDLQGAAALGTLFDVDIEHPFEQPAHLMRAGADGGGASPCSAEVSWVLIDAFGMISEHSLALGASTP